jgi:catechol 2,3-dioxygenase-like lactoylglutathione lyase family enzyme
VAVVRYLVDDVETAIAFYTDRLGFALEHQMGPAFAIVSRGGPLALAERTAKLGGATHARRTSARAGWVESPRGRGR